MLVSNSDHGRYYPKVQTNRLISAKAHLAYGVGVGVRVTVSSGVGSTCVGEQQSVNHERKEQSNNIFGQVVKLASKRWRYLETKQDAQTALEHACGEQKRRQVFHHAENDDCHLHVMEHPKAPLMVDTSILECDVRVWSMYSSAFVCGLLNVLFRYTCSWRFVSVYVIDVFDMTP